MLQAECTYTFSCVNIFKIIDINVAEQDQTLDMIRVVLDELVQERCCF